MNCVCGVLLCLVGFFWVGSVSFVVVAGAWQMRVFLSFYLLYDSIYNLFVYFLSVSKWVCSGDAECLVYIQSGLSLQLRCDVTRKLEKIEIIERQKERKKIICCLSLYLCNGSFPCR